MSMFNKASFALAVFCLGSRSSNYLTQAFPIAAKKAFIPASEHASWRISTKKHNNNNHEIGSRNIHMKANNNENTDSDFWEQQKSLAASLRAQSDEKELSQKR